MSQLSSKDIKLKFHICEYVRSIYSANMARSNGSNKKIINNYKGWEGTKKIDEIDADVDPEVFWRDYISQRKPVRRLDYEISPQILSSLKLHPAVPSQNTFFPSLINLLFPTFVLPGAHRWTPS